jgi:hypothetical protein
MTITKHALKRSKERGGFGKSEKRIMKMAERAYAKGMGYDSAAGRLKVYMKEKMLKHGNGYALKVYGGYMFIFSSDEKLITMYPVPGKYLVKAA